MLCKGNKFPGAARLISFHGRFGIPHDLQSNIRVLLSTLSLTRGWDRRSTSKVRLKDVALDPFSIMFPVTICPPWMSKTHARSVVRRNISNTKTVSKCPPLYLLV